MLTWESLFEIYNIHIGQMLLTREDFRSRPRYLNARDMLNALLEHRIVPVINENDAVATAEIKVGDNDNLSALVALLAEADLLLLLTDQAGLFTADPRTHPGAQLIPEVRTIDDDLYRLAGGSVTGLGVGGMTTKLQAADVARAPGRCGHRRGRGRERRPARRRRGSHRHTVPRQRRTTGEAQALVFGGATPRGRLLVDAGTARALTENGSSLLPAGIVAVEGHRARRFRWHHRPRWRPTRARYRPLR